MKAIVQSVPEFLWIVNAGSDAGGIVILLGLFDSSMILGNRYRYFQFSLVIITYRFLPDTFGFAADQFECSEGWNVP